MGRGSLVSGRHSQWTGGAWSVGGIVNGQGNLVRGRHSQWTEGPWSVGGTVSRQREPGQREVGQWTEEAWSEGGIVRTGGAWSVGVDRGSLVSVSGQREPGWWKA